MPAPLRITERSLHGILFLQLDGQLVFDEGDRIFRERLTEAITGGARAIVVDLEHVTYMDSGGVGALVETYLYAGRHGGRMVLVHPTACSTRVLQITRLSSVFEIFPDQETAVRTLTAPSQPA